jgi:putative oxidoreductase
LGKFEFGIEPQTRFHQGAATVALPLTKPSTAWHPSDTGWLRTIVNGERVESLEKYGAIPARLLISQIFIFSGVGKIIDPQGTMAQMEGRGMFWIPFFLVAAIVFELAGGFSVLLGYKARLGALALFLFLIPVTLTFHNFWTYPEDQKQQQMIMFMHNLTLMGGLLLLMSYGPGPFSLDRRNSTSHGRNPDRRFA